MLRSKHRRVWGAVAIAIAAIALALLLVGLPRWVRTQGPVEVVYMEPIRSGPPPVWRAPAPPPPEPQPVPAFEPTGNRFGSPQETARDRAEWVGGAVVTCDLSKFAPGAEMAFVAADQVLNPDHPVDIISRFGQVHDGHLHLVVTEPSGEVSLTTATRDSDVPGAPLRLRWDGALPGTTVGCTGIWEAPGATIRVRLVDEAGAPFPPGHTDGGPASTTVLRGCGVISPYTLDPTHLTIEAGTCALRVERRNSSFPLIVARSTPVAVRLFPGESLDVTLTVPDEPPLWQPPDLVELQGVAEIAAWAGSAVMSELIDELVGRVMRSEWDGALPEGFGMGAQIDFDEIDPGGEPPPDGLPETDLTDAEIEAMRDRLRFLEEGEGD